MIEISDYWITIESACWTVEEKAAEEELSI